MRDSCFLLGSAKTDQSGKQRKSFHYALAGSSIKALLEYEIGEQANLFLLLSLSLFFPSPLFSFLLPSPMKERDELLILAKYRQNCGQKARKYVKLCSQVSSVEESREETGEKLGEDTLLYARRILSIYCRAGQLQLALLRNLPISAQTRERNPTSLNDNNNIIVPSLRSTIIRLGPETRANVEEFASPSPSPALTLFDWPNRS